MIDAVARALLPQKASIEPQKAVTGPGAAVMSWGIPISEATRGAQQMMREAQAVYARGNRWVRRAEMTISNRVGSVPWHLETDDGETVTDESPEELRRLRDLFEKPLGDEQFARQYPSQPSTRRSHWGVTSRHSGLCNVAFWHLDELDAAAQFPQRIFMIRPDRMTPRESNGQLIGWTLDKDNGGGTDLSLEEVLPFYLDQPDKGYFGTGLVESVLATMHLPNSIDRHAIDTLGSGGRLPGIYAPNATAGALGDDVYDRLVGDLRTIKDMPDSSKRDIVARAPIEFTPTSADMAGLAVQTLSQMSRDDTLIHWGVPLGTIGGTVPSGLGSESRKFDEAALWQNAVQFRIDMLWETIQYRLLDRLQRIGVNVRLVIETPTFDDEMPKYELAQKAQSIPLTNKERRAILGLDPFGVDDLDNAIVLPMQIVEYGTSVSSRPADDEPLAGVQADVKAPTEQGMKAAALAIPTNGKVRERAESALERDVNKVLDRMRSQIAKRVEAKHDHLARKPSDTSVWCDEAEWRRELEKAIRPHLARAAETVSEKVTDLLGDKS